MKLNRLYIGQHLLLRNLDLDFDRPGRLDTGEYALDFLVGVNGSGKSTILRALAQILLDLRADRVTDFDYTLEYQLAGQDGPYRVFVRQFREGEGAPPVKEMKVELASTPGQEPIYDESAIDQNFLPEKVVIYTTGRETEWERMLVKAAGLELHSAAPPAVLEDPVQRNIVELPGHLSRARMPLEQSEEESPHLFIRSDRLAAVTLCGLLAHLAVSSQPEERPLHEVLNSLGLRHVRGFSLRFRLHKRLSPFETFDQLKPLATRHVQQGNDHLLVFDLSSDDYTISRRLIEKFGNILELYKALDSLQDLSLSGEPTLQQVNLFLERDVSAREVTDIQNGDTTNLFLLDWLSDGEQSFLGRMALLAMLDTENSLILLDEPEVHFNDYWKREVVNLLDKIMHEHSNHLLITTHSSILLSDVPQAQVTLLVKGPDGWAQQQLLRIPLLAVDPSEIMVNWFGTERSVGERSTRLLTDAVERGDVDELEDLLKIVGPGFWRYRIEDRLEELRATPD